jgi:2-polyprenyl-6-methoxyphenol hydroxylase-like FAD-dependent oxidoreductase
MKPIEIIGAGLAGLALGNALQRDGVPVTLHEAGTLPRHRVCGEFICGRGGEALRNLGFGHALADAAEHRSTLWRIDGRRVWQQDLPQPAIGLSRYTLDERLALSFGAAGGQLFLNSRRHLPTETEGAVFCKGRRAARSDWIGLKVHCLGMETEADLELHLGHNGYVGLSAVENGRVNVCALFKQNPELRAKREDWLAHYLTQSGMGYVAQRLKAVETVPGSHSGVAGVEFSRIPAQNDASIFLGDAYSVIPPFTGNGMSIALESAELAYPVLKEYSSGAIDWKAVTQRVNTRLHQTFDHRLRTARRLHPWLHSGLGQRTLAMIARTRLLPFNFLYSLTH